MLLQGEPTVDMRCEVLKVISSYDNGFSRCRV